MAAASVADEVNEHIFTELASVLDGQLGNPDHSFGIIPVDMEHGAPECLGQVRRVLAGAARIRGRREPDLVIHRDVDSSADGVAAKLRQVDGFLHDAQARHSSVAVDQDGHQREALVAAVQNVLLGSSNALCDGVHGLQVGRVRRERDVDFTVIEHGDEVAGFTQVVLHVTGTTGGGRINIALELGEDLREGLADDIRQDVQPPAVSHADDHFVEPLSSGGVNGGVHERNEGLGTFEGESFLPDVLRLEEVLKGLRSVELLQNVLLLSP